MEDDLRDACLDQELGALVAGEHGDVDLLRQPKVTSAVIVVIVQTPALRRTAQSKQWQRPKHERHIPSHKETSRGRMLHGLAAIPFAQRLYLAGKHSGLVRVTTVMR